ncbi:MAG: hypothetical protein JNM56_05775 [Planctomycetia bacterium]|nr:hypothetical protein [Planctomycetia bacterium]
MKLTGKLLVLFGLVSNVPLLGAAEQQPAQLKFMHAQVTAADFSPGGKMLASAGEGGVVLWDLAARKEVRRLATKHRPQQVRFSPDGTLLAAADPEHVYVWQPENGRERLGTGLGGSYEIHALGFSACGDAVTVFFNRGQQRCWDTNTREGVSAFWKLDCRGGRPNIEVALDGRLLVNSRGSRILRLTPRDGSAFEVTAPPADHCSLPSLALAADGKTLAAAGNTVFIWETATGKELAQYPAGHYRSPLSVALSPDGKRLATPGTDGYPWDRENGYEIIDPNGFFVRLRETNTGKELRRLAVPAIRYNRGEAVGGLRFSPNGKTLVGLGDGMILLWDVGR